jgi:hypothetical protein
MKGMVGRVARMMETKNSTFPSLGKEHPVTPRRMWEDNIKMVLRGIRYEGVGDLFISLFN